MSIRQKSIFAVCVVLVTVFLAGCTSQDGQRLSKALVKQTEVKNYQTDSKVSVNIKPMGSDVSDEASSRLDLLNSAVFDIKQKNDVENNKAIINASVDILGMGVNGDFYSDGKNLWMKLPGNAKYIKMDPSNRGGNIEPTVLQNRIKPLAVKFIKDFASEYKYTFSNMKNKGTSTVTTPEGPKQVTTIEVAVDNREFPKLLEYSIKNFSKSSAAREYLRNILLLAVEMDPSATASDLEESQGEIDEMFQEMNSFADNGSKEAIDELMKIFEVGPKGLVFDYSIDNSDNIIKSAASLNFIIKDDSSPEKVEVTLNVDSTVYNVNNTTVQLPTFTKENTVPMKEYVKSNDTLRRSSLGRAYGVEPKKIAFYIGQDYAYTSSGYGYLQMDAAPYIENESTMVPVRFIGDALDAEVNWDDETQGITYNDGEKTIVMHIGSNMATVNGKPVWMPVAPTIKNDRTMIPVRFVSEQFGANVEWNDYMQAVVIEK